MMHSKSDAEQYTIKSVFAIESQNIRRPTQLCEHETDAMKKSNSEKTERKIWIDKRQRLANVTTHSWRNN